MTTMLLKPIAGREILLEPDVQDTDPIKWFEDRKQFIESVLLRSGIVLIRGLADISGDQFSEVLTTIFGSELGAYTYRSTPRTEVNNRIYTASEYHHTEVIPQHNENSYADSWPLYIGFLCKQSALKGGNTPVSDSREAYARIPQEIRDEFQRKKVMYVRNYTDIDLPWTEVFQTSERSTVERFCADHDIRYEWTDLGLRTFQVSQAVIKHPFTSEDLWFNQAHLFHISSLNEELRESLIDMLGEENLPRNVYFGDGMPISSDALSVIRKVYEDTMFSFRWQNNDILLLDNMLYTHGRQAFEGERKVLVGMARQYQPGLIF